MVYFSEHDLALISAHRKPASRFGFAVLLCYLKNVGFAPDKKIPPLMFSLLTIQLNHLTVFLVSLLPNPKPRHRIHNRSPVERRRSKTSKKFYLIH